MTARDVIEDELRPLLRGVTHAYAFWVALAAALVLTALVPAGTPRVASVVYGIGLCGLFAASGTYHRWRWNPRWRPLLRRIDHSTIFIFIAASYTPVALLVMHGTLRWVILVAVWTGATIGVVLSVAWITAPRVLSAACYLALGWTVVFALPQMLDALDVRAAGAARGRRAALHGRRDRLRDQAPEPVAEHLRLPRGLPRAGDPRGRRAVHRAGGLGLPRRLSVYSAN